MIANVPGRDWLLLAVLVCAGVFWYVGALAYSAIAGTYVLEWSGVGPGLPAKAVLAAVGSLGTALAALVLVQPIASFARNPLPLAVALALLVPLVLALGMAVELDVPPSLLIDFLGLEELAFTLTCILVGYGASRKGTRGA